MNRKRAHAYHVVPLYIFFLINLQKRRRMVRRVRIMCHDRYATDDSSDDDEGRESKRRLVSDSNHGRGAKTLRERSPTMFSRTYVRKRKRGERDAKEVADAGQSASKKLDLENANGSGSDNSFVTEDNERLLSPSSPLLLDSSISALAKEEENSARPQEEELSISELFMQHQYLLNLGFKNVSWVVDDLETFGQVFDDFDQFNSPIVYGTLPQSFYNANGISC